MKLKFFELTTITCLDLGAIMDGSAEPLLMLRSQPSWRNEIFSKLRSGSNYFNSCEMDDSEFSKTDRRWRSTFSESFRSAQLPLLLPLKTPTSFTVSEFFECQIHEIRIAPIGSISIRSVVKLRDNLSPRSYPKITDVLAAYHGIKTQIWNEIPEVLNQFVAFWNGANLQKLASVTPETLRRCAKDYEIVDFDPYFPRSNKVGFKGVFSNSDIDALREIAGLSRMTATAYQNYDAAKIERFFQNDFSNRDDEIWMFNHERFIRHHPERVSSPYNRAFFYDVKLAIETIFQFQIALESLTSELERSRMEFRDSAMSGLLESDSDTAQSVETKLSIIVHLVDIFARPHAIIRDARHAFFATLVENAFDALKMHQYEQSARQIFSDFFNSISTISQQKISRASFDLSRRVRNMTVGVYLLTFIMAGIMVFEVSRDHELLEVLRSIEIWRPDGAIEAPHEVVPE